jgi:hypothetical protein
VITVVKAQQDIISCLDITVPLMTPSTPAYLNKYCHRRSAVSPIVFLLSLSQLLCDNSKLSSSWLRPVCK